MGHRVEGFYSVTKINTSNRFVRVLVYPHAHPKDVDAVPNLLWAYDFECLRTES